MKSTLTEENLFKTPIVFGNFMKKGVEKKQRIYEESRDFAKLSKTIFDYMQDETNMNLILFSDVVLHICRVSRCLIMEKGHILLVGLTGSGKQSSIMIGAVLSQC
jgi:dynein heavy chain